MAGTTIARRQRVLGTVVPLRVTHPGANSHTIRRRAERDGYVFCRALVPRNPVDALRGYALTVASELDWLAADAPADTARAAAGVRLGAYDDPRWLAFLRRVMVHHSFAALRSAPEVAAVLTAILGARPESDAGDLCRVVSSDHPEHTTVAHQDRFYLPDGAPRWSVWMPLGPCPLALGPLAVLPGSHRRGLRPHAGEVAWRRAVDVADDAGWAASDLKPGDAILFSCLTVHRALPNVSDR